MKKMISYALFASMALFASCSQDETLEQVTNAPGVLSFTTTLPNDGAQTKAADNNVQRYIMQLYYNNGTSMTTVVLNPEADAEDYVGRASMTSTDGSFTIDCKTLALTENTEYTAVFWADDNAVNAEKPTYDASWLTGVKYSDLSTPMTASYYGTSKFTYNNDMASIYSVTLNRAVAKINFIQNTKFTSTNGDRINIGYTHYGEFNALTGTVPAGNPEGGWPTSWSASLTWTQDGSEIAENTTIASVMTFAPSTGTTSGFYFYYNEDYNNPIGQATNVPLQANYQTNIRGNYQKTSTTTFSTTIDAEWGQTDKEDEFDTPAGE